MSILDFSARKQKRGEREGSADRQRHLRQPAKQTLREEESTRNAPGPLTRKGCTLSVSIFDLTILGL